MYMEFSVKVSGGDGWESTAMVCRLLGRLDEVQDALRDGGLLVSTMGHFCGGTDF